MAKNDALYLYITRQNKLKKILDDKTLAVLKSPFYTDFKSIPGICYKVL